MEARNFTCRISRKVVVSKFETLLVRMVRSHTKIVETTHIKGKNESFYGKNRSR